jgi:hypothetical protein
MRFVRFLLVGAIVAGAAACTSTDASPTRATVPPLAFVRYIYAVPDTFNTSVRWVDDLQFTPQTFLNVAYRAEGQGGFQGLRAGSRHFRIFTFQQVGSNFPVATNTLVLADTTYDFEAGRYYTIILAGNTRIGATPQKRLLILQDDPPASPTSGILLRVYNLSRLLTWDLYMGPSAAATADGTIGGTYTAGQVGTLVSTGAPANAETATRPYGAFATGTYGARLVPTGTLTSLHNRVTGPTGLPETVDFEAVGGTTVAGSVLTAWVFDGKAAGSPNATAVLLLPSVTWTVDRKPARTIAP